MLELSKLHKKDNYVRPPKVRGAKFSVCVPDVTLTAATLVNTEPGSHLPNSSLAPLSLPPLFFPSRLTVQGNDLLIFSRRGNFILSVS